MNESTRITAREVYAILIETMRDMGWSYEERPGMQIVFSVQGSDIPMNFRMTVNENKETVVLYSLLPFQLEDEMKTVGAIAVCSANYRLADGSFDYDTESGSVYFRMTANYRESKIGKELLEYMIRCSSMTVDRYNDKLLMLSRGIMNLDDFYKEIGFQ